MSKKTNDMPRMRKIAVGKFGQKLIFNRDSNECKRSNTNGNVGACFFHDYYFISTGDSALLENKYDKLQEIFDTNHIVPRFFAKLITKMFMNGLYSWGYKVSKELFNRELILLPCLEVSQDDEYIWEENGRYYTLAVEYISYLYLTGRINKYQKLIDTYTYMY